MTSIVRALIDIIIPPRLSERVVRALGLPELQSLDGEDGLPYHDPRVTSLVWELKYYANRRAAALAGALVAEKLLAAAAEELGKPLLVPVPMHAARRRERGHNQTELLCEAALKELRKSNSSRHREFSAENSLSLAPSRFDRRLTASQDSFAPLQYEPRALVRLRATATQQGLPRQVRLKNVKKSMVAPEPELIEGRACIVVDDVTTTGATLAEATRALRDAGARAVQTIVLARS